MAEEQIAKIARFYRGNPLLLPFLARRRFLAFLDSQVKDHILEDDFGTALFGSNVVQALRRTLLDSLSDGVSFKTKAVSVRYWPGPPLPTSLAETGL